MTENRLFCGCLIRHGFLRLVTLVFLVGGQAFLPTRANASIIFTQLDPTYVVQANGNNPLVRSYDIDINSDGKRDVWVGFNGKAGNISSYGDVGFLGYLPNLPLQQHSDVYRLKPGAIIGANTPNEIPDFSFPRGYHVNPLGSSVGNLHVTYDTGKGGGSLTKLAMPGFKSKSTARFTMVGLNLAMDYKSEMAPSRRYTTRHGFMAGATRRNLASQSLPVSSLRLPFAVLSPWDR